MGKFIFGHSASDGYESHINVNNIVAVINEHGESKVVDTNGKEYGVDCPAIILVKQINEMIEKVVK